MDESRGEGATPEGPPRQWLESHVRDWIAERLITSDQGTAILERHGMAAADEAEGAEPGGAAISDRRFSLRLLTLGAAAALFIIGLLLIVASNWDVLSYPQRLALAAAPGAVAAAVAPWFDRSGWRHNASQFLDALPVASLLGVAAVISQHLQQSGHDWIGLFSLALVPAILYAEVRRNSVLATAGWGAFAGLGLVWLGQEMTIRGAFDLGLDRWALFAAGLSIAIRAQGRSTPIFAIAGGGLAAAGLAVGSSQGGFLVVEAVGVGLAATLVCAVTFGARVWRSPGRAWTLALTAVVAAGTATVWSLAWDIRGQSGFRDYEFERLLTVEGSLWIAPLVAAVLVAGLLLVIERRGVQEVRGWWSLRWALLLYAIAGAFAGVGQALVPSRLPKYPSVEPLTTVIPWTEAGMLAAGIVAVAVAWKFLNRTPMIGPLAGNGGPARLPLPLTPGAPLAAAALVWSLWLPLARLVNYAAPNAVAEVAVPFVQWGFTVLTAVWIMGLLAQQALNESRFGARLTWGAVGVFSIALLILAYSQQEGLLERGFTFATVGLLLVAGVFQDRLRGFLRRFGSSDRSPGPRGGNPRTEGGA